MMDNRVLSQKIARTLLAMSFVYAGGMFAPYEKAAAAAVDDPVIKIDVSGQSSPYEIDDAYNITGSEIAEKNKNVGLSVENVGSFTQTVNMNGDINIELPSDITNGKALSFNTDKGTINIKGDLKLQAANNRALFFQVNQGERVTSYININPDKNKTVQILGDIEIADYINANGGGYLTLNLSNADSYLAGDLWKTGTGTAKNTRLYLNLYNGAVWYPLGDSYTYTSKGMHVILDLDGGSVDLYHSRPDVVRTNMAQRIFEIGDGSNSSSIKNTTFIIGSDLAAKTTDELKISGENKNSSNAATNYIKLAIPQEVSSKNLETPLQLGTTVVTLEGGKFTTTNTIFEGKATTAAELAADGGLTLIKDFSMTPDLAQDGSDKWKIDTVTMAGTASKGAAMTLAESSAGSAAAVLRFNGNDLLRRLGELHGNVEATGVWARAYGGENEISSGGQTDLKYHTLQGGYDWTHNMPNGKLVTGLAVSYLKGSSSFASGSGDVNSTMFGLYGSYIGDKGHYADFIAKYGRISHEATAAMLKNTYTGDFDSNAFTVSAEYGYRQQLPHDYFIEPQVELTYGNLSSSDYSISSGAKVYNDAYRSLIGRLGMTLGRQYNENNVYLKCSLAHEFQGEMNVTASYKDVTKNSSLDLQDTWLEYGIGFNSKLDKNVNLYGEIERSTGSEIKTKWRGNIGLRCTF